MSGTFPAPARRRRYLLGSSLPYDVEIHDADCSCPPCNPPAPSVPRRLTGADMGKLAVAAAIVGSVIAFAIDPHGAAAALLATVGL